MTMNRLVTGCAAGVILIAILLPAEAYASPPAPAWNLEGVVGATAIDGTVVKRSDLAGKVVLIEFWATWCAPCLAELPKLKETRKRYGQNGFEIVAISVDTLERRELFSFLLRHGVTWPQLHDGRGIEGAVAQRYGIDAVPRSFLFDRQGRLVAVDLRAETLKAAVAGLLSFRTEDDDVLAER